MARFLFLIRHGRTEWNDKRGFMGQRIEAPLHEEGIRQVKALAKTFPHPPSFLFSSPLLRARQTVHLLLESWKAEVEERAEITEVDFGDWTGKLEEEVRHTRRFQEYLTKPDVVAPPKGETMMDVQKRALLCVNEVRNMKEERVGIVTHMDVIRALLCHFLQLPLRHAFLFHIHTASLSAVDLSKEQVLFINWLPSSSLDYFT